MGGGSRCLEAVYEQARGVEKVVSGYAAGHTDNPTYEDICSGTTGHAEVVQSARPTSDFLRTLLEIFFTIHDPTTPNRQGNDRGTQYRSIILYHDDNQKAVAQEVMREINDAGIWSAPIVTQLQPLEHFYPGEGYHQGYYRSHESQPYCQFVVAPKVVKFREKFRSRLKANA